jgi:hypothetical protein
MKINTLLVAGFASMALATAASANTILTFAGSSGPTQQATASFNFTDANHFVLSLTNNSNITDISSILDDFHFNLSGTPTGGSGLSTITSHGHVDCTASTNTVSSCTNNGVTDATGQWSYLLTAGHVDLISGTGMHPYGIVNNSIFSNANLDGLRNALHNPYLMGPVTFTFAYTGLTDISITNVVFSFGTTGTTVPGTPCTAGCGDILVPEPAPLALIAIGMLALVGMRSMRRSIW